MNPLGLKSPGKTYFANHLSTLEHDECRHGSDIVLGRDLRDLVDINFEELDMAILNEATVIRTGNRVGFD